MKLVLDQGLPHRSAAILRERGIDAVHASECGLSTALDEEILAFGRDQSRVVVTLDADLHSILAVEAASAPSVVRVRIEGLRAPEMATLIQRTLDSCEPELKAGAAVSVTPSGIRVKRLPITV
jgi:predicted nuclease of predicted toxin-antitoxin system